MFKITKGIGRTRREKTEIINKLRAQFPLSILLDIAGMSKSTFYYNLSTSKDDKNKDIMQKIKHIFESHNGNYGYRRITVALRSRGIIVNHKKVKRLMKVIWLFGKTIRKRNRYSSYKGTIDKIADNKIKRNFTSEKPKRKCYTYVTEFKLNNGEKIYLSPILDGFNSEIISYDVSTTDMKYE